MRNATTHAQIKDTIGLYPAADRHFSFVLMCHTFYFGFRIKEKREMKQHWKKSSESEECGIIDNDATTTTNGFGKRKFNTLLTVLWW